MLTNDVVSFEQPGPELDFFNYFGGQNLFLTYETEFVLFSEVLENSVLPIG